jgi:hypothetical protein
VLVISTWRATYKSSNEKNQYVAYPRLNPPLRVCPQPCHKCEINRDGNCRHRISWAPLCSIGRSTPVSSISPNPFWDGLSVARSNPSFHLPYAHTLVNRSPPPCVEPRDPKALTGRSPLTLEHWKSHLTFLCESSISLDSFSSWTPAASPIELERGTSTMTTPSCLFLSRVRHFSLRRDRLVHRQTIYSLLRISFPFGLVQQAGHLSSITHSPQSASPVHPLRLLDNDNDNPPDTRLSSAAINGLSHRLVMHPSGPAARQYACILSITCLMTSGLMRCLPQPARAAHGLPSFMDLGQGCIFFPRAAAGQVPRGSGGTTSTQKTEWAQNTEQGVRVLMACVDRAVVEGARVKC